MIKVICEWFIIGQVALVPGIIVDGPEIRLDGTVNALMIKVEFKDETVWMNYNSCLTVKETK